MNAILMPYLLAAVDGPASGSLIVQLVYFLIAILFCGLVYYCAKRFFPEAAFVVLIVLVIVLLIVALKIFGLF
jgi:hypothetical protein